MGPLSLMNIGMVSVTTAQVNQSKKKKKRKHASGATNPQHWLTDWLTEGRGVGGGGKTLPVACICCLAIFILTSVYAANSNLAESLLRWFLSARLCLFALLSAVASPQHLNTASGINRTERRKGGKKKSLKQLCLIKACRWEVADLLLKTKLNRHTKIPISSFTFYHFFL